MAGKFPRLPCKPETKAKIAAALRGRKHTDATKAKIAQAMTGRVHSAVTKAKCRRARLARVASPEATVAQVATARAKALEARRRTAAAQHRADLYAALESGDMVLFADVKASHGYRDSRRVFDPTGKVSDGRERSKWRAKTKGRWDR